MARGIRDEDADDGKFETDGEAVGESDKALRVQTEHGCTWVPKSVIHDDSEVYAKGHSGILAVHAWWASKQGWE
jgi:hypothetical protein